MRITHQELYVAARIGEWMIVEGLLSSREVELIVDRQDKGDKRLFGEIAVADAYITPFDVQRFLSLKDDNEARWSKISDCPCCLRLWGWPTADFTEQLGCFVSNCHHQYNFNFSMYLQGIP